LSRLLYDLAGANDLRFSPYCWRARMALLHKGLDFETEPCRFTEIGEKVAFAGHDRVPVLVDGDHTVADSWRIALHLEDAYPDRPSLFGSPEGLAHARFMAHWVNLAMSAALAPAIVADIYDAIDPADRDYFRTSREKRFGRSFADLRVDAPAAVARVRHLLEPVRLTLTEQPFLSGERPLFADYILFGHFQWARCSSPQQVLAEDDPLRPWRTRMLDLFDGYARAAPCRDQAA